MVLTNAGNLIDIEGGILHMKPANELPDRERQRVWRRRMRSGGEAGKKKQGADKKDCFGTIVL